MSENIKTELDAIKARNQRVEIDKAWETSRFRVFSIALLTYAMMVLLMSVLQVEKPHLSALVPTAGFMLSTVSLRFAKRFWIEKIYKKS